jgi:hypothetical protein
MIESETLEYLLFQFDTGASTAENDPLLEVAKIETQQFHDLYWQDRIDIIKGIKGAGKTALYRLCYFLRKHLIDKKSFIAYSASKLLAIRSLGSTRKSLTTIQKSSSKTSGTSTS